jgi:hypothetical protein
MTAPCTQTTAAWPHRQASESRTLDQEGMLAGPFFAPATRYPPAHREKHTMLQTISKTVGGALALLGLAATFAIAAPQTMTCTASDGKGNCTVATGADGKGIVVVGEGVQVGDTVACQDRGYMINCATVDGSMQPYRWR